MIIELLLAVLDIVGICSAIFLSTALTLSSTINIFSHYTGPTIFTITFTLIFFYIFNLYDTSRFKALGETVLRVFAGIIFANLFTGSLFYLLGHWNFPKLIFFLQIVFSVVFLTLIRWVFSFFSDIKPREKVIIIGAGRAGNAIAAILQDQVAGFVDDDSAKWKNEPGKPFVTGPIDKLLDIARQAEVKKLILAITHDRTEKLIKTLLQARLQGFDIEEMASVYEKKTKRIPVHHIQDRWLLLEHGFSIYSKDMIKKVKRFCDVCFSALVLICFFPFFIIISILIKKDSPGPIIFKQKRVGLNDKEFVLYKFRTMYQDAEKHGAVWAQEDDPRVTKVGKWLRKLRLDEIPQFWNVLKGDMSIIGPRPERREFVEKLEKIIPYYYLRHTVKPGITGWAQINYPYGATVEDAVQKLEYELYYIKNMSPLLDTKIFLRTIGVMLFGQGAR